jgi:hypothetical protein
MRLLALILTLVAVSACATPGPRYMRDEVIAYQGVPLEIGGQVAAAPPKAHGAAPAFPFTCTTTAQRITPPSGDANYRSITVWNAACTAGTCTTSATPVFVGGDYEVTGSTLSATAVTTSTGMPLCTSTTGCIAVSATYDVPNLQCIVQTTPTQVTVQVIR